MKIHIYISGNSLTKSTSPSVHKLRCLVSKLRCRRLIDIVVDQISGSPGYAKGENITTACNACKESSVD